MLRKFEEDLGFNYELVRAVDPKWGTLENGAWNGLMAELVGKRTDMVLSALKVAVAELLKVRNICKILSDKFRERGGSGLLYSVPGVRNCHRGGQENWNYFSHSFSW